MKNKTWITPGARITPEAGEWYSGTFPGIYAGSNYVLEAFPSLYKQTLAGMVGRLSQKELLVVLDAMQHVDTTSTGPARVAGQHLCIEVSDAVSGKDVSEKWSINKQALSGKLLALTLFERACVEVWARSFWDKEENRSAVAEHLKVLL